MEDNLWKRKAPELRTVQSKSVNVVVARACVCVCMIWLDSWRFFAYNEHSAVDDAVHPRGDAHVGQLGEVVPRPLEVDLCA